MSKSDDGLDDEEREMKPDLERMSETLQMLGLDEETGVARGTKYWDDMRTRFRIETESA